MKKALCIKKSFEEIKEAIENESSLIETLFVNREICEKPENGYLQIIPYVTFYTVDAEEGKITFLIYKRANNINEKRLLAKSSIGFGGHIDSIDDIEQDFTDTEVIALKDNDCSYIYMTMNSLIKTCLNAGKREILEELGQEAVNLVGDKFDKSRIELFMGNQEEDVNKVHLGLSIQIDLSKEEYLKLKEVAVNNKEEIESIGDFVFDMGTMIQEFELSITLLNVSNGLKETHNLEDWSLIVFRNISHYEANKVINGITYKDILSLKLK